MAETLKDFGLRLRKELLENPTEEKAKEIAGRINSVKCNGELLSTEQKEQVLKYIKSFEVKLEKKIKPEIVCESDNSEFLALVDTIISTVKGEK
jgi:hypothetical protein